MSVGATRLQMLAGPQSTLTSFTASLAEIRAQECAGTGHGTSGPDLGQKVPLGGLAECHLQASTRHSVESHGRRLLLVLTAAHT